MHLASTTRRRTQRHASETALTVAAMTGCAMAASRINRWGATDDEVARALPGDDEVRNPAAASTRAVTINAPAQAVWPWLVQMGWHRAGWYAYDSIDNDHLPSAEQLLPEFQGGLHVGDFVPEGPDVGWTVIAVEPGHLLLLTTHGPMAGVDWVDWRDSSWLFLVEPLDDDHSRLIERARTTIKGRRATLLGTVASTPVTGPLLSAADFVMAHRHMKGIKHRAERAWLTSGLSPGLAA